MIMNKIIFTLLLLATSARIVVIYSRRHPGLRVINGVPATDNKYSYVVALVTDHQRSCTGSLLMPEWILTAAHCLESEDIRYVQYGNMTIFPNISRSKSVILQKVRHPGYRPEYLKNDVGMVRVTPISLSVYGTISSLDYAALFGLAVEYAGYGTTEYDNNDDDRRPLMVGEGVVRSCVDQRLSEYERGLFLCVAPKCSNDKADSAPGDSGGPLFYDSKIIGVVSSGIQPIGVYTPISPYITWLHDTMTSNDHRRYVVDVIY